MENPVKLTYDPAKIKAILGCTVYKYSPDGNSWTDLHSPFAVRVAIHGDTDHDPGIEFEKSLQSLPDEGSICRDGWEVHKDRCQYPAEQWALNPLEKTYLVESDPSCDVLILESWELTLPEGKIEFKKLLDLMDWFQVLIGDKARKSWEEKLSALQNGKSKDVRVSGIDFVVTHFIHEITKERKYG